MPCFLVAIGQQKCHPWGPQVAGLLFLLPNRVVFRYPVFLTHTLVTFNDLEVIPTPFMAESTVFPRGSGSDPVNRRRDDSGGGLLPSGNNRLVTMVFNNPQRNVLVFATEQP